jgi:hypothetical protein
VFISLTGHTIREEVHFLIFNRYHAKIHLTCLLMMAVLMGMSQQKSAPTKTTKQTGNAPVLKMH